MRPVKVVLENSKGREVYHCPIRADDTIRRKLARWLDRAVDRAQSSGACVTFAVSVHQDGADCDHEVPS